MTICCAIEERDSTFVSLTLNDIRSETAKKEIPHLVVSFRATLKNVAWNLVAKQRTQQGSE